MFSEKEIELMRMVYENDNPEQAVLTAIEVFTAFLTQLEAAQEQPLVCPQESA